MMGRGILSAGLVLAVACTGARAAVPQVVESWIDPNLDQGKFRKLIVICITDDQKARHRFEDKFVSHLQGRGIGGVTSHSLVPDLATIENRERILTTVAEQRIDGAISVRLVPLQGRDEAAWTVAWQKSLQEDSSLRLLIEETLPQSDIKVHRYGVEVALWEAQNRYRVWAGRTDAYTMKQLKKGAGEFVQFVVDTLKHAGLL